MRPIPRHSWRSAQLTGQQAAQRSCQQARGAGPMSRHGGIPHAAADRYRSYDPSARGAFRMTQQADIPFLEVSEIPLFDLDPYDEPTIARPQQFYEALR